MAGKTQEKRAGGCRIGKNPCFSDRVYIGEELFHVGEGD